MPRARKREAQANECCVCFESVDQEKASHPCKNCTNLTCNKCIGKLVEICGNGCPCAHYKCPTCRGEVAFVIESVADPTLLQCIIAKYRQELRWGDEEEDEM